VPCHFLSDIIGAGKNPVLSLRTANEALLCCGGCLSAWVLLIMAASCGAGPIMRRSFRTSDGVNLSYLEAGHEYPEKNR